MPKALKRISPVLSIDRHIHVIRGRRVMLASDLAAIYGVLTGNLNLAVRRNRKRFPEDFMFVLTRTEADSLILQSAISNSRGGRRHLPYAFTELGVAMLSSVLTSTRAVQMNIDIMRAFVRLRSMVPAMKEFTGRIDKLEQKQSRIASVIQVLAEDIDGLTEDLRQMKAIPPPRKRRIGF